MPYIDNGRNGYCTNAKFVVNYSMACVYRHIRLDKNEPFYIGIGAETKRAYTIHKRTKYWTNVSKQGYEVDILFDDIPYEDAKLKEKEFIKLYGRIDLGTGTLVNLTDGGDGSVGYKHTKEGLLRIGEKSKGRKKSPEQIKKWKESRSFVMKPETKEKIRMALMGRKHSEERRKNQSISHIGRKASEETKEKLRQYMLKRAPYVFTPEALFKLSESHKGIKQSPETIQKRKDTIAFNKLKKKEAGL